METTNPNVLPVASARKRAHLLTSLLLLVGGPGCGVLDWPPGDGGGGTTGGDGDQPMACFVQGGCNGAFVYAYNDNEEANDVTGADGGADGGEQNYWYDLVDPQGCEAQGGEQEPGTAYCKTTRIPGTKHGAAVEICVGEGYPAELADEAGVLDPTAWSDERFPSIDDEIRAEASTKCSEQNDNDASFMPLCEDANWSDIATAPNWTQATGFNCQVPMEMNDLDPDGSEVPWELVAGGSSTPLPLDCALDGDCVDLFDPSVGRWILTPGVADLIEPESRTAQYLGVDDSSSTLELDMAGTGAGIDDTQKMFGIAEYSAVECGRGEDVCPFYLANLIAYNTTDTWEVRLATVNGPLYKEISDVQVDLLQSTLGVQNMGLGAVAFAPGALRMRVQFTVSSCGTCDDFGDGVHASIVENDEYVFAAYDDGELTITQSFEVQSNSWATLSVTVVPDEHPPVAAHDLNSLEWANHPQGLGLVVDESRSLSDDPDDDIVFEFWWVDGDPIPHGGVVPHGSHAVAIEAHDARGAVHRSAAKWVYVGDATFAP